MRIAIIGAGAIGGTLATRWAGLGHHVRVAGSGDPAALEERFAGSTVRPSWLSDLVAEAEIVIVSVPTPAVASLRDVLSPLPDEVVVVDTGNYVPGLRDGHVAELDAGRVESQWVEAQLGRRVLKAFNTVGAESLRTRGRARGAVDRIAVPIAGDRAADRELFAPLVDDAGFDPLDVGSLSESWRQQPGTPIYTADLGLEDGRAALAAASRAQTSDWRRRVAGLQRPEPAGS